MEDTIEHQKYKNRSLQWLYRVISFVVLFLSWEILARTILETYDVPSFFDIVRVLSLTLVYQLMITLVFSLFELFIILAIGLPLGKRIYTSQRLKPAIYPALWFLVFAIGAAIIINVPILIIVFGISRLLIFLQSLLVPILAVTLISGNGQRLAAIKIGYLLCLFFQIMGEIAIPTASRGIGHAISWSYYLHDFPMLYAALMLIGLGGMFVEEIFIGHIGNKLKMQ